VSKDNTDHKIKRVNIEKIKESLNKNQLSLSRKVKNHIINPAQKRGVKATA
jgi:hypothetical protein